MKKITYSCELCGNERDIDDLLGLRNGPLDRGNNIELTGIIRTKENSTRHICLTCSDIITRYREDKENEQKVDIE